MELSKDNLAELGSLLNSLNKKIGATNDSPDLEREAGRHLNAIQDSLKCIVKSGANDVFARYLMEQLESLATDCTDASKKGVLRVTEHQFKSAGLLLDAFGSSERVIRYTWQIATGQRLFSDETWRNYFELSSTLAMAGAMKIRALLIMEDRHTAEAANVQKVLEFFAGARNLTGKIVQRADWDGCAVDYAIPPNCIEFGIFGTNLLYQANSYTPISVGLWSKDAVEIARYARFFDSIWDARAIAAENSANPEQNVRLSQVIAVDSAVDRRQNAAQNVVHERLARIEGALKADAA